MRSPKFTPGPWSLGNTRIIDCDLNLTIKAKSDFAVVFDQPNEDLTYSHSEAHHNARAITAVPEMYAILAELEVVDTLAPVFADRIKNLLDKIDGI